MANIQFQGVQRVFRQNDKEFVALKGIDLVVQDREFVAIVGPSGCGKTTCMRMAAGLEFPTTGTVKVNDVVVTEPGPDRAVVFQQFALFPWKSNLENVAFGPLMQGRLGKKEIYEKARSMMADAGLSGTENNFPGELSSGLRRRVEALDLAGGLEIGHQPLEARIVGRLAARQAHARTGRRTGRLQGATQLLGLARKHEGQV